MEAFTPAPKTTWLQKSHHPLLQCLEPLKCLKVRGSPLSFTPWVGCCGVSFFIICKLSISCMFSHKLWQWSYLLQVLGQMMNTQVELAARKYRAMKDFFSFDPPYAPRKRFASEEPLKVNSKCGQSLNCLTFFEKLFPAVSLKNAPMSI